MQERPVGGAVAAGAAAAAGRRAAVPGSVPLPAPCHSGLQHLHPVSAPDPAPQLTSLPPQQQRACCTRGAAEAAGASAGNRPPTAAARARGAVNRVGRACSPAAPPSPSWPAQERLGAAGRAPVLARREWHSQLTSWGGARLRWPTPPPAPAAPPAARHSRRPPVCPRPPPATRPPTSALPSRPRALLRAGSAAAERPGRRPGRCGRPRALPPLAARPPLAAACRRALLAADGLDGGPARPPAVAGAGVGAGA